MKKVMLVGLLCLLAACGNSGGGNGADSGSGGIPAAPSANGPLNDLLKVLASNVIVGTAQAADGVDEMTKVLASNVVLDHKALGSTASTLQELLDEQAPDLKTSLVGTWTGKILTRTAAYAVSITFNTDASYVCTGAATVDGKSNPTHWKDADNICAHATKWEMIGPRVIALTAVFLQNTGTASAGSSCSSSDPTSCPPADPTPPPPPPAPVTVTQQLYLPIIAATTTQLQVLLTGSGTDNGVIVVNLEKAP